MPGRVDPKTGIEIGWPRGDDAWGTGMNANLQRLIYTGYRVPVKGIASAPPASPQEGDTYLVGSMPSGSFSGFTEGDLAVYGLLATSYTCLLYTSPSPRD